MCKNLYDCMFPTGNYKVIKTFANVVFIYEKSEEYKT